MNRLIFVFTLLLSFSSLYASPRAGRDSSLAFSTTNLFIPFNNAGIIADVPVAGRTGMQWDTKSFVFSGGFAVTGLINDTLFASGQFSASRISDYLPGMAGGAATGNYIFSVPGADAPFSLSWQQFSEAVQRGADFYDGNKDGLYTPTDLNNNGRWDAGEDRPNNLGDFYAWLGINDAQPSSLRRFSGQTPIGLNVQQTIYSWNLYNAQYANHFYIRYRLIYTGSRSNILDSVYFGVFTDPDIGDYATNLIGSDTARNLIYTYNKSADPIYGVNSPAFGTMLLNSGYTYKPGVTYTDNNANGVYDEGTDTPLDSVLLPATSTGGTKTIRGASAVVYSSGRYYTSSHPTNGDAGTPAELRNYMRSGRAKTGEPVNVCTWPYGNGAQVPNCSQISARYFYSGNPLNNTGWIHTYPNDQRMISNAGPFRMEKNKPVDIWVVYVAARGTTSLGSITGLQTTADFARTSFANKFSNLINGHAETPELPLSYSLQQNYPNPFNPETVIGFTLPRPERVLLQVYNTLGELVFTATNADYPAGTHTVAVNAASLNAGVYFYTLTAGNFTQTKKMMILK